MKRRLFLGITLGALSLPVLAQSGRLYGAPQSVTGVVDTPARDRLKLELSRVSVPPDMWEPLSRLGVFWEEVLHDHAKAAEFNRSPRAFLARHRLENVLDQNDGEVRLLQAVTDPALHALAANGSYAEFFGALAGRGLLHRRKRSELKNQIREALARDLDGLRMVFTRLNGTMDEELLLQAMEREPFQQIALAVAGTHDADTQSAVAAAAVVVIAVGVVAYASVVISVTVGITLGFSISAAVSTVVAVGGPCEPECHYPHSNPVIEGIQANSAHSGRPRELAAMLGSLGRIDVGGQEDLRRVSRVAMLLGNKEFPRIALRTVISEEIEAMFGAYRDLGLLEWRQETYDLVVHSAKELAYRSVGVAEAPGATAAGAAS